MTPHDGSLFAESSLRQTAGRRIALAAGALVVGLLVLFALHYRSIAARAISMAAWSDAERMARELAPLGRRDPDKAEDLLAERVATLVKRHGGAFREGYFDHRYFMRRLPPGAELAESLPAWLLIVAYEGAMKTHDWGADSGLPEVTRWLEAIALSSRAKEALVNLLAGDYGPAELIVNGRDGSLVKQTLLHCLYNKEFLDIRARCRARLAPDHWGAVLEDCHHPRAKVRAGALLLLYHHPSEERFRTTAHQALADPSEWVRLAAAGTLGIDGWNDGVGVLQRGLDHPLWEIRFWCAIALRRCTGEGDEYAEMLAEREPHEPDSWVRRQFQKFARAARRDGLKDFEWAFGRPRARREPPRR